MRPVILIGAARSGTNMIRDILDQHPDYGTWPCDEIPYIWRHGNINAPTDEFLPSMVTSKSRAYIINAFDQIGHELDVSNVIEKTCANSLRVDFIDEIFPQAKYVFIVRDGRDVVASAMKRWTSSFDLQYTLKKVRYVPIQDFPVYGFRYLKNRFDQLLSKDRRLSSWGPVFNDMDYWLKNGSLFQVCAMQWVNCVERAQQSFDKLDASRVIKVNYETFVTDPELELKRISNFLGSAVNDDFLKSVSTEVNSHSIGSWKKSLAEKDLESFVPLMENTLAKHGYISE